MLIDVSWHKNKKIRHRSLQLGDLALKKVNAMTKNPLHGKLRAKWEGPYIISMVARPRTYYIKNSDGEELSIAWNIIHLKR